LKLKLELKVIRQNAISIIFLLYHQSIYVLNYLVYCFGVGHVVCSRIKTTQISKRG
jgi:hypothetical protein